VHIKRLQKNTITAKLFKNKAIILIGPRQTGKTTLLKKLIQNKEKQSLWLNCDEPDVRKLLEDSTSTQLKTIFQNKKIIVIDEAQRVKNIGITIKLVIDNYKDIQIILTGSSALELSNSINEPLTGRKFEYFLYPISFAEMVNHTSFIEERRLLEHRLIYGYYPEIITEIGNEKEILALLSDSYLYKDIFTYEQIKKPAILEKLLQALALQVGNEVKYQELSRLLSVDFSTIERYIDLLEKACIIFKLTSLSRNVRNEIKKGRKIYFYDNGIRNSIIRNYSNIELRQDIGALWENFLISERMKTNHYNGRKVNSFFWRTHTQQEIDYIEEHDGKLFAYEFKWNKKKKAKIPKSFTIAYDNVEFNVINSDNFHEFVMN